jgi:hypothetical protein
MTNHLKSKHPSEYLRYLERFHRSISDARIERPVLLIKSLGQVKHWSKNRNQTPERSCLNMEKGKLKTRFIALSSKVCVVAVQGDVLDWAAYIDAVAGNSFDKEFEEVARTGTKIPQWMAEQLFPDFAQRFRWRD